MHHNVLETEERKHEKKANKPQALPVETSNTTIVQFIHVHSPCCRWKERDTDERVHSARRPNPLLFGLGINKNNGLVENIQAIPILFFNKRPMA